MEGAKEMTKKCEDCKYYNCFEKKQFPCIDCDMRYKDRFERRKNNDYKTD